MSIVLGVYDFNNTNDWGKFKPESRNDTLITQSIFNPNYYFQSSAYPHKTNLSLWHDEKSEYSIIADARIFNKQELLAKLSVENKASGLISDCCLILYAYQQWGTACLDHLSGDFVFAIWDPIQKHMFLARDHLGQRSFFYSFEPGKKFYFANSVKPLFTDCNISKSLNQSYVADFLALLPSDRCNTFFHNIKRLPPGHFMLVSNKTSEPVMKCYWSMEDINKSPLILSSHEEYYLQFQELYQQAVARRMAHTENIGCHLSGGLDSSSVTCIAAHLRQQENKSVTAFCHIPTPGLFEQPKQNWNYNDRHYMELVGQQFKNISLNYIEDDEKQLFEYVNQFHPWLELPVLNPYNVLWFLKCVEQAKGLGINTILTGQAGNFTISWPGLPVNNSTLTSELKSYVRKLKNLPTNWHRNYSHRAWKQYSAINRNLARKTNLLTRFRARGFINYDRSKDNRRRVLNGLLDYGSSLNTAFRHIYGVEHLDPTADKDVVEFCLRIPCEVFKNEKYSRLLVREGTKHLMPQAICERTSRGMQAADWYKKLDRKKNEIMELLLSWKNAEIADYIDIGVLLKELDQWDGKRIAESQGKEYKQYEQKYQLKLLRAIEVGLFIQKHKTC